MMLQRQWNGVEMDRIWVKCPYCYASFQMHSAIPVYCPTDGCKTMLTVTVQVVAMRETSVLAIAQEAPAA